MPRRLTSVLLVVAAALAWVGAVLFFLGLADTWDAAWLDVTVYREAALKWLAGGDVYGSYYGFADDLPFTYPPFALLLFVPLALANGQIAIVGAFVGNAVLLCLCLRWCADYALPAVRVPWGAVAVAGAACAVFIEPVRTTIGFGQINVILLALVLGLDARGTRWAGVGAGVGAAIKVTPGLLVVAQLVRGDVRAFGRGVAAFAACTALAAVWAWGDTVRYFGHLLWQQDRPGPLDYDGNQSVRGLLARLELNSATLIWVLLAAVVLATAAVTVYRHRLDPWAGLTAAAVGGLLVSPVSWNHHWVWVLPATAVGIRYARARWLLAASVLFVLATGLLAAPRSFLDVSWLAAIWPFGAVNAYVLVGALWLAALACTPPLDKLGDRRKGLEDRARAGGQA